MASQCCSGDEEVRTNYAQWGGGGGGEGVPCQAIIVDYHLWGLRIDLFLALPGRRPWAWRTIIRCHLVTFRHWACQLVCKCTCVRPSQNSFHTSQIYTEAQWPIGYGVGLQIKRSSVRIQPWSLRWVLGQGSLLPLSQGEAFTLASISYLAILVKYILAKKNNNNKFPYFHSR